jgi:hypothetical protein
MFNLTNDQIKFIGEFSGILKAMGGSVPPDSGERETTFEYQFFGLLKAVRERVEETGGFIPRVTTYPDGSKAEFVMEAEGPGIKFTPPDGEYTLLRVGEGGVTVNGIPVALGEGGVE